MGEPVGSDNDDLKVDGKLLTGYTAGSSASGTCAVATCGEFTEGTHVAGIIAGVSGNFVEGVDGGEIQGIAYDARIKPIDIATGAVYGVNLNPQREKFRAAIVAASGMVDETACTASTDDTMIDACKTITVMNNGWSTFTNGIYAADGETGFFQRGSRYQRVCNHSR